MSAESAVPGNRLGFTLIELLIAIVIFSAVVSMTYGAYNMTFKVINNASTNSKYSERARITLERIADDLESLYLGDSVVFQGETASFGEFRGDGLRFSSTAHLLFHKEDIARGYTIISYTVEEHEDTLRLYRGDTPVIPGAATEEDKGFVLCDLLREVAFEYIDKDSNESDTWGTTEQSGGAGKAVPSVVKVKLGFASEENEEETIYFSSAVALPPQS